MANLSPRYRIHGPDQKESREMSKHSRRHCSVKYIIFRLNTLVDKIRDCLCTNRRLCLYTGAERIQHDLELFVTRSHLQLVYEQSQNFVYRKFAILSTNVY